MNEKYNVVIIGSGPGGYVAAIKAAKLGLKTAIIENREIGGTCLNRGCIPTKTLMHSSHLYQEAKNFEKAGIHFEGIRFDMEELQQRKEEVVHQIRQGIVSLLDANKVTVINGTASISKNKQIIVRKNVKTECSNGEVVMAEDTSQEIILEAEHIVIATGSKPVIPRIEGTDLPNVITSDELLAKGSLYKKLLIIGGGVIGIEFASIYCDLGCEVEVIEAMDRILPGMDKEISQSIAMSLKKKGVTIHTKSKVTRITEGDPDQLICEFEEKDSIKTTVAEGILISVGRKSNTEGLFDSELEIDYNGATLKVNEKFETSISGIYAIGDVIHGKQLAHAASAQGITVVERICGVEASIDLNVIPSCIYTTPEVASVGMNEEEATAQGYQVRIGKYPMLGNAKTLLSMGERGFIKVLCDAETDKILGAGLLCERATDLVSEFATAIVNGLTAKDMAAVIRPHPTYSEAITEAVEAMEGMAIHLVPKRR